jgi:hypothetical protein
MSDNYPEKNIVEKLTQLGEAFQGLAPDNSAFPPNFPGKKIADKIDELIAIVREGGVIGDYDKLENKPAIDGNELDKDSTAAGLGLETVEDAGSNEDLVTTDKSTLVKAVNEVSGAVAAETAAREAYDQQQDAKLQTLNGHYFPLDGYDFGKSLDVKTPNPDDIAILNTYAMTMEGVDDPADIIEDTVIKNEFDGVEFVWNAAAQAWLDWGVGNIVTASNEHLGVVEGTVDPGDGSKDGFVTVRPGGVMEAIGFAALKGGLAAAQETAEAAQTSADGKQPKIPVLSGAFLTPPSTAGGDPGSATPYAENTAVSAADSTTIKSALGARNSAGMYKVDTPTVGVDFDFSELTPSVCMAVGRIIIETHTSSFNIGVFTAFDFILMDHSQTQYIRCNIMPIYGKGTEFNAGVYRDADNNLHLWLDLPKTGTTTIKIELDAINMSASSGNWRYFTNPPAITFPTADLYAAAEWKLPLIPVARGNIDSKQDKIAAGTNAVLGAPGVAGGTPEQLPLTGFIRAGISASYPAAGTISTAPALLIDSLVYNYYNEGMRINAAAGNRYAGIVLGGKPGSINMVDEPGYGADQASFETRRAAWFIASANNGDFIIAQDSNALPNGDLKGLLIRRNGEAYLQGGQRIVTPQFTAGARLILSALSLGIPANTAAGAAAPLWYSAPTQFTLIVDQVNRICYLNGYLSIFSGFTGGWEMPLITIPNSVLPNKADKMYVMGTGTLHKTTSDITQVHAPIPISYFIGCPANPADGGTSAFNVRFYPPGAYAAGYFNECFIDCSWTY